MRKSLFFLSVFTLLVLLAIPAHAAQPTPSQKVVDCGSTLGQKDISAKVLSKINVCMDKSFSKCSLAKKVLSLSSVGLQFEIIGQKGTDCTVRIRAIKHSNKQWIGKEMICPLAKSRKHFTDAFDHLNYDNCKGALQEVFLHPNREKHGPTPGYGTTKKSITLDNAGTQKRDEKRISDVRQIISMIDSGKGSSSEFPGAIKSVFSGFTDPSGVVPTCTPKSTDVCEYAIKNSFGGVPFIEDYQVCFFLEKGSGNLSRGVHALKKGGSFTQCRFIGLD